MTPSSLLLGAAAVLQAAAAPAPAPAPAPRPARVHAIAPMPGVAIRMPRIRPPRFSINVRGHRPPGPDSVRVAALLAALAATEASVCELAVDMLGNGWWGHSRDLAGLRDRNRVTDSVRSSYQGEVTDRRAVPLLLASLARPEPCVRRAAARLIGGSPLSEASAGLRSTLRHADGRVREAALLALGISEDPAAFEAVLQAVGDRDPEVVRHGGLGPRASTRTRGRCPR